MRATDSNDYNQKKKSFIDHRIDWEKRTHDSRSYYYLSRAEFPFPYVLKLKQMGAWNEGRALQEIICFYAKNLSLQGLMHFLLAAIMPRLITREPGENDTHIRMIFDPWLLPPI